MVALCTRDGAPRRAPPSHGLLDCPWHSDASTCVQSERIERQEQVRAPLSRLQQRKECEAAPEAREVVRGRNFRCLDLTRRWFRLVERVTASIGKQTRSKVSARKVRYRYLCGSRGRDFRKDKTSLREVDAPVFGELHLIKPDTDALGKNAPRCTCDRQQRAAAHESTQ